MILAEADLRPALLPVRHQGRRSSCLSFASTAAHEHDAGSAEHLSVEYLHYHSVARMHGKDPTAGTAMLAAAEALAIDGQPIEAAWPYSPVDTSPWSPPSVNSAILKANLSVGTFGFSQIVAALDAGRPVVLGLIITDAFYHPDVDGRVDFLKVDPERAGHAVLAVGHVVKSSKNAGLLVRNSWGPGWGLSGYGWLPKAYVDRQLRETALLT